MKNFAFNKNRRRYVYYYKLNDEQKKLFKDERTDIKIELTYTLGGYNYFSGNKNPRGYKIYLTPVTQNGCMESCILLGTDQFETGYYINVEAAERYNAKRLTQLAEALDSCVEQLGYLYLNKLTAHQQAVIEKALATEAPKPKIAQPGAPQKNLCGKTRPVDNPYEIWVGFGPLEGWEWRVLKKWQTPDKECNNPYARWFCAVKSPMTYGEWEYGDTYIKDVVGMYSRLVKGKPDLKTVLADRTQK